MIFTQLRLSHLLLIAMKKIVSLLLLVLFLTAATNVAQARDTKPGKAGKKAFRHNSESSKGKNSKAQFRSNAKPPVIDLTPRKQEKFKTARANPGYKYMKAR
jgi:hypothetical protein